MHAVSLAHSGVLAHTDVIGVSVGIVGILLACVFYVRSKEEVKPRILMERTTLIGRSERLFSKSVEVRYNDEIIPILSKVRITFWNAGRKTLDQSDIVKDDPIVITFSDPAVRVLDIRSFAATRDVINANAVIDDNSVCLSFDFLDQNDGLTLEAFYDSGSETGITVGGTIKGVRKGISGRTRDNLILNADQAGPGIGFIVTGVMGLGAALVGILDFAIRIWGLGPPSIRTTVTAGVLGISLFAIGIYKYRYNRTPVQLQRDSQVESTDDGKSPRDSTGPTALA